MLLDAYLYKVKVMGEYKVFTAYALAHNLAQLEQMIERAEWDYILETERLDLHIQIAEPVVEQIIKQAPYCDIKVE